MTLTLTLILLRSLPITLAINAHTQHIKRKSVYVSTSVGGVVVMEKKGVQYMGLSKISRTSPWLIQI